ncbi:MAG: hypothetical protein GY725_24540 [bacterium]|nr:hypothetical protein [bacterium]
MKLLLSYALRAIQIALVAACFYAAYVGVSPIISSVSIAETTIPPAAPPPERNLEFARFQVIASRNLFKSSKTVATEVEIEQDEIKETKLRLKLIATAASNPVDFSIAVIENLDLRQRLVVGIGEEVASGATLSSVEPRRALIDNKGVTEAISMDDEEEVKARNAKNTSRQRKEEQRRTDRERRRPNRTPNARSSRGKRPTDRVRDLKKQLTPSPKPRINALLNSARVLPHLDENGQFSGMKLSKIKPNSPFAGMPDGSVCFEINNSPITSQQALAQAMNSLDDGTACVKCRTPDGSEITRCF